jgi:hypothetical protein
MIQKLFIQDWDNFSDLEQNHVKELISISLKARELRLALLSGSSVNLLNEGFEVTSNVADPEAKPLEEVLPRVRAFLSARSDAINALEASSNACKEACDDQYPNNPQKRQQCKQQCKNNRLALEKIMISGFFI